MLEAAVSEESPQQLLQGMLLSHIQRQCEGVSTVDRARIMGMSTPTYLKRLKELSAAQTEEEQR